MKATTGVCLCCRPKKCVACVLSACLLTGDLQDLSTAEQASHCKLSLRSPLAMHGTSLSGCRSAGPARLTWQLRSGRPAASSSLSCPRVGVAGWQAGLVSGGCSSGRRRWSTLGSKRVLQPGHTTRSGTWQPGSSLSGGSSDGSTSIDSEWDPAQSCPLHACLLQYGISNLAAFCRPRHLALSQEAVSSDVEPKLAALAAEGLSPRHLERLLLNNSHQLLACSYRSTFKPNLQLLRQLAVYREHEVHPEAPQLTAVGKLLAASTPSSARYLACDPRKVQQLVQWLGTNLDVTKPRLAGCSALCQALQQTAASVEKAAVALQEQSVPKHEVARVFLVAPGILGRRPALVAARAGFLAKQLQVDPAAAMNLIVRWPPLALREIEARLPPLLNFLDDYMGVEGAGQRLVLEQPAVAGTCADSAQCSTSALEAVTGSKHEVLATVEKLPTVLMMNLSTPLQQQKLEWIAQSPWPLVVFLSNPRYLAGKTRRLASRMAFLRESGLPPPASPALLVTRFDDRFRADVSRMLKKQGRELLCASWPEWLAVWLGTDEGKKWGFPPLRK